MDESRLRMPESQRKGQFEVASLLRDEIHNCRLKHLDRLPSERDLANLHNVARGTIRGVLRRLAREGLVEKRRGSGTYITYQPQVSNTDPIRDARPLELIDVRFAIEPHICRLCVLNAGTEDFDQLEHLLQEMQTCVDNPERFSKFDTDFHARLAKTTRNQLLIWIIEQINAVRNNSEWLNLLKLTLDRQMIQDYNLAHRAVVDAIKARDADLAARLMRDHLQSARLSILRAMDT
jgi:DNA-binding FadR family transcriptional regulator